MLCRLCISDCDHNSLELFDSGGKNTTIYNVVAKYFENEIKNMDEVKAELDAEQCQGITQQTSQVICANCWRHIDDFHQWQKELVILKDERLKLLQQPYQRELVESVKLEMEIDVNNLNIYEESFADDTCDNDDYFNEDTEDPVAICEAKLSTAPKKLPPDEGVENVANDDNDSLYDDMPLLRRMNLRQTKTSAPTKKKAGRRKKLKKVVKKASDVDTDLDYNENEDKDEANSVEKVKEKSSKTKEFDAFIAQHFKDKLPCELCGHLSADFTELRTHFREVHNSNKGYVLCCKHKYSQRFHFVEHLQVHLNPQKFQCAECGKCSANGRSLVAHMNSMHKPESLERRFECEVCHKKFAKLPILKTHMETHAEGNPDHICKECGKGFILESRLNIHIRNVHSTAYHSVCDQCGKSFRGRYALKYHLLEHDGAGKQLWPCDQCDAKLHSKFSLKRHKRITHHDGSTVYVCGECGKVALTEDALKSHKRYVHQRERIHKCTVCDKAFKRGRQVIAVARTCNLIFMVLDCLKPLGHKKLLEHELEGFGIRLNKKPPNIYFKRKDKGGVNLNSMVPQSELDADLVKTILSEYKIHNADITLRYDATSDDLIDVIEGNRIYIPCIYLLNKIDQISIEELDVIYKIPHCVPISAHHRWNFDDLLEMMWEYLKLVRIYTKPKGQLPDYNSPIVLHNERTSIQDFCNKLHRSIAKEFKYALVWGSSVKHQPQKVGIEHILNDEDVVQIVKKV